MRGTSGGVGSEAAKHHQHREQQSTRLHGLNLFFMSDSVTCAS